MTDYWWLSFADPQRRQGSRFLGVVVVDADKHKGFFHMPLKTDDIPFAKAVARAHALGVNPGGEVQGSHLGDVGDDYTAVLTRYEDKLLDRNTATELDTALAALKD